MQQLVPLTPRVLKRAEVYGLALMYWGADQADNAVAVAYLESSFFTAAHNLQGEDSRGLWQINVVPGAHPNLADCNLFDPQVNAYWAYQIWRESGWAAWYNSAKRLGLI